MHEGKREKAVFVTELLLSAGMTAAPVLFLENSLLSGICAFLGLAGFIWAFRKAETLRVLVRVTMVFWLASTARFSTTFGKDATGVAFVALLMLLYCNIIAGSFSAERFFRRKNKMLPALLCFPLTYTLVNLLTVLFGIGNLQNIVLYGICVPCLGQSVSVLGEYGMTFVLALLLSLLTAVFTESERKQKKRCLIAFGAGCAVLLAAGGLLRLQVSEPDYTLRVAIATQEERDIDGISAKGYTSKELWELLKSAAEKATEMGADLMVLPEEYYVLEEAQEEEAYQMVSELARNKKLPILLSVELEREEGQKDVNKTVFFDADGEILCSYVKQNLVPLVEAGDYERGRNAPEAFTVQLGGHEVNVACVICFDVNNAMTVREIPKDTELLLVPSWDWDTVNLEQRRTVFRSIERKTTILKFSYGGFAYASGPAGVWKEMLDLRDRFETVELIEVPVWEKQA